MLLRSALLAGRPARGAALAGLASVETSGGPARAADLAHASAADPGRCACVRARAALAVRPAAAAPPARPAPTPPPPRQDPTDVAFTAPEAASAAAALALAGWYVAEKHWLANNALGLAFSVTGIEHLSLGAVSTGAILLSGLFVYDVFWVFCTPVMVSVAKSFDAPIKLLFPRAAAAGAKSGAPPPFSMLGLGDIVIPGVFVALLLRFDAARGAHAKPYFPAAFAAYTAGLATTIVAMHAFDAAQPALLYIVPAVLGAVAALAAARGEVGPLLAWSEDPEDGAAKKGGEKKKA